MDGNLVLLEHLQHSRVRDPTGETAAQCQPDLGGTRSLAVRLPRRLPWTAAEGREKPRMACAAPLPLLIPTPSLPSSAAFSVVEWLLMEKMRTLRSRLLFLAILLVPSVPLSAAPVFSGTPEIEQSLRKLNVLGSVLMIAPIPTTRARRCWPILRAAAICGRATFPLTRGEGGQNLIGSEQGDQLGIIRTQELLAARRSMARSSFLRAPSISALRGRPRKPCRNGVASACFGHGLGDPELPS